MANTLQIKRGTDLSNAGTPAAGEPVWNSSTSKLYIGDGSTAASSLSQVGSEFLPLAGGTLTGTLNGTTAILSSQLILPNGVAGTPAIRFADGDSGVYASANGEVAISTNGTQRLKIDDSTATFAGNITGKVGYLEAPSGLALNLDTASSSQNCWVTWNDNGTPKWEIGKNTAQKFYIHNYAGNESALVFDTSSNATFAGSVLVQGYLTAEGSGDKDVTIKSTDEDARLYLNGYTSKYSEIGFLENNANRWFICADYTDSDKLKFGLDPSGASTKLTLDTSGNATFAGKVQIGSTALFGDVKFIVDGKATFAAGSSTSPSLTFKESGNSEDSGLYMGGTNIIGMSNNGATTQTWNADNSSTFAGGVHIRAGNDAGSYFHSVNTNTLNFAYHENNVTGGWVNYFGYQGGTTQFRDFYIGNGKQAQVAYFKGSDKSATFAGEVTIDGEVFIKDDIINRVPSNGTGIIRMSGATDDSEGFFLRHNHVGGSGASAGNFQIGRRWGGSDPSAGAGYAMQITGGYVTTFNGSVGVGGTHTPGQPLDVRIDQNSDTVARVYNNTAGTSAAAAVRLKTNSALGLLTVQDDGYSTSGMYIADGMSIFAADGASGGLLLGTEGDDPVLFYQDRTEKMRIHTNGNVGIGTSTPDFLLDVESTGTPTLCVRNSAASADAKIIIGEPNTTAYGLEMKWKGSTGCAYFDNRYDHSSNPHMYFRMKTSGTPITALTINPAGNVGIGATPLYPLHVNTSTDKNLMVRDSVAPTGGVMLQSVNDADSAATAMELRGSLFSFQVGNVGIGVTDPDNVLEVNGDISTSTHNQAIMARYGTSNNYAALLGWSSVADGAILQLGNNNANNEIRAGHQSTGGGLKIITNNTADYTAAHNGTVALAFTSAGVATFGGNVLPSTDNSKDLGSSSLRWANIYVGDMHLKNDRGDWTVIEEEDYLSLKNNKNGKTYKLVMEEV